MPEDTVRPWVNMVRPFIGHPTWEASQGMPHHWFPMANTITMTRADLHHKKWPHVCMKALGSIVHVSSVTCRAPNAQRRSKLCSSTGFCAASSQAPLLDIIFMGCKSIRRPGKTAGAQCASDKSQKKLYFKQSNTHSTDPWKFNSIPIIITAHQ